MSLQQVTRGDVSGAKAFQLQLSPQMEEPMIANFHCSFTYFAIVLFEVVFDFRFWNGGVKTSDEDFEDRFSATASLGSLGVDASAVQLVRPFS